MTLMRHLVSLYRVDSQVRGLRSRLDAAQHRLDAQVHQLADFQQQVDELRTRHTHVQASMANHEMETAAVDERIEKLRGDLNSAVTNKQYSAVLSELNTLKDERSRIEDRIIEEMEQIEQLNEQLDQMERTIAERARIRDGAMAELRQREEEIGQRLAELEAERQQAAALVPDRERAVFDELAETYEGEAMAAINVIDRKRREYACGACNMYAPVELVSLLLSGSDSLVRCPACTRILFLQEETRGQLVKK